MNQFLHRELKWISNTVNEITNQYYNTQICLLHLKPNTLLVIKNILHNVNISLFVG